MIWPQDKLNKVNNLRLYLEKNKWKEKSLSFKSLTNLHENLLEEEYKKIGSVFYHNKFILNGFNRITCGAHGHYIEFEDKHLFVQLKITTGQEWRNLDKYNYVKYLWMNPIDEPNLKIYKQKHTVKYADYKPGFYYVDFWTVEIRE